MGLKHFTGLILLIFLISTSIAQKRVVIHGRITDNTGKGIGYAAIQNINTSEGINSDARGFFILKTKLPASLQAFALGFNTGKKQIEKSDKDTVELNFTLEENAAELRPITISASQLPQLVEEKPNLMDFELKNGNLWLVYSVKGGDKIEVVDTGGRRIAQLTLKYHFHKDSINQTPHGFLYSIYKDSLQLYGLDSGKIEVQRMLLDTYKKSSGTLVGFKQPYYYYIKFDSGGSRVNYYCYDRSSNKYATFFRYFASPLFRANRETEEKMLAIQLLLGPMESAKGNSQQTGPIPDTLIDLFGPISDTREIKHWLLYLYSPKGASVQEIENILAEIQGSMESAPDPYELENELSTLSTLISQPFTILRTIKDSVYVFNFENNMINVYSPTNAYVRQEPFGISVHAIRFRKKEILVDDVTQECYFKYTSWSKHTYIEKIDLATGRISYRIELKFPFVDKVRISGGYAYFSYFNMQDKDNIYNGKTCLYKQRLN